MNYVRATYYPFHGEKWFKRLLIGAIISVIPVVNFLIIEGYANEVTRRVARGDDGSSPEWDSFGRYLIEGLSQWFARFVHFGLLIIVGVIFRIPLLSAVMARVPSTTPLFQAIRASMPLLIALSCLTLFILIVTLWLAFYLLASDIRYSTGESRFAQLFEVRKNIQYFSRHRGKIMLAWISSTLFWVLLTLISFGIGIVPIPAVSETLAVVFFFTNGFMLKIFTAHIYGQVAQKTIVEASANAVVQAY